MLVNSMSAEQSQVKFETTENIEFNFNLLRAKSTQLSSQIVTDDGKMSKLNNFNASILLI